MSLENRARGFIESMRDEMKTMDHDFEGMQRLEAQIEKLKELLGDTSEGIENDWFNEYGIELAKRIRDRRNDP